MGHADFRRRAGHGRTHANASPPVFFAAPGTPYSLAEPALLFAPRTSRGDGASRDASIQSALDEARARLTRRARPAALHRGDFSPRGRASGRGGPVFPGPYPGSFRRPSSAPRPAIQGRPHSKGGRRPEASREQGYEPRPQAPHPAPSSRRLATTPSAEPDDQEYIPSSCRCQARRADAPEFLAGAGIRRAIHDGSPQRFCLRPGFGQGSKKFRRVGTRRKW